MPRTSFVRRLTPSYLQSHLPLTNFNSSAVPFQPKMVRDTMSDFYELQNLFPNTSELTETEPEYFWGDDIGLYVRTRLKR